MSPQNTPPERFTTAEACVDWLIARAGKTLRVGAPLGLGKPATLLNALYQRAKADPAINLTIITALSLDPPKAGSDLEARLMDPIVERVFEDYPGLDYMADVKANTVPDNITISEFFFQPGALLGSSYAQRHYRSVNYTHAARDLMDAGVNVLMQMVAPGTSADTVSLSCNTDVTLELMPVIEAMRQAGNETGDAPLVLGQLNTRLPTMTRSALVSRERIDGLFEGPAADFKPFGAPAAPVPTADYAIAARVTALLADGGTLQIGIGSLSDAIAWCADLRQNDNAAFARLIDRLEPGSAERALIERYDGYQPFSDGLYGCTEMLVDAYLHLYRAGVIKRAVYDDLAVQRLVARGALSSAVTIDSLDALCEAGAIHERLSEADIAYLRRIGVFREDVRLIDGLLTADGVETPTNPDLSDSASRQCMNHHMLGVRLSGATLVHGGFFLGPTAFYDRLKALAPDERELFHMTSVGQINQLYGDELLKRAQRVKARFVNTAIKVSLDGAVAADGLDDGRVLSGVGGQYNFVAQAHELADARSILCIRATRSGPDGRESNIVTRFGYNTIPRHLRDIVVTEYGVADLRGATDEAIAIALIEIADAEFQDALREAAVKAGKLCASYTIPERARRNIPAWLAGVFDACGGAGSWPRYPYGSDFTPVEDTLITALKRFAGRSKPQLAGALVKGLATHARDRRAAVDYLERMELARPSGAKERLLARVVTAALRDAGHLGAS